MPTNTHWSDVLGNDVTARDLLKQAKRDGVTDMPKWLQQQYRELYGSDIQQLSDTDAARFARQISEEA